MRLSLLALATVATLLGACTGGPNPSTVTPPPPTAPPAGGSPLTASGKLRVALMLPLSGRAAPVGQSMQQAAEMSLFDGSSRELALAAYDSGDSAETAMEAYRKARTEGVAVVLGPLFGTSATALASMVREGGPRVIAFSNDETAAQPGVWIMGIAAPPQVRRVVDHAIQSGIKRFAVFAPQTTFGEEQARTLESHAAVRGGTVVAVEMFDESPDLSAAARRLAAAARIDNPSEGKIAVLVPVSPPRLSAVLAALSAAGIDSRSVQYIGTGVWDVAGIGSETLLRGAWYAAPDPAKRADFERRFISTYGRPPHRLATLAYDAVGLAGQLARVKPGGDFSAEAITNPNGWSGVDGAFRFLPDGRSERSLTVIEVQDARNNVISPAPSSFARPSN